MQIFQKSQTNCIIDRGCLPINLTLLIQQPFPKLSVPTESTMAAKNCGTFPLSWCHNAEMTQFVESGDLSRSTCHLKLSREIYGVPCLMVSSRSHFTEKPITPCTFSGKTQQLPLKGTAYPSKMSIYTKVNYLSSVTLRPVYLFFFFLLIYFCCLKFFPRTTGDIRPREANFFWRDVGGQISTQFWDESWWGASRDITSTTL